MRKPRSAITGKLGREMDLFHFQEEAPGAVFWHPKGWTLFQALIDYMRQRQARAGYVEINTPDIMERSLWERSGHWDKFGENMFTTEAREERVFALKPMNCPGGIQVYKQGIKSYPRSALAHCRVRQGSPVRAVGRPAWSDAPARLHSGRRPHLLYGRADHP